LGFADGLMEVRRLVMGVQSRYAGPFLDLNKYFRIAGVLSVADAASFLARLRREPQNDGGDWRNRFVTRF
jgi:hypothetical protein